MKKYITCLLVVLMTAGAANLSAQGGWVYAYSPWSPTGGSWQFLNGRGQVVSYQNLPLPNARWATPAMLASAQRSVQTVEVYGKTIFSAQDAQGNDVYFEEDPRQVATAAAITRRSRVDSIRAVAEVERYRVRTENRYRKKVNRRDQDDEEALNTDRHQNAMRQIGREVDSGLVSRRAGSVLGYQRNPNAVFQPSDIGTTTTPASPSPAPKASGGTRSDTLFALVREAYRTCGELVNPVPAELAKVREIFWRRVDAYVNEAAAIGDKANTKVAADRLYYFIQNVTDGRANPDWVDRHNYLQLLWLQMD